MSIFSAKLDAISETIRLVLAQGAPSLNVALASAHTKPAIAVGSGGSCISAAFLSTCRTTLGAAATSVQTPMELCLADGLLESTVVFLFSAAGNNADILAAHESAIARGASSVHVVTNNASGILARVCAESPLSQLHVIPTSDTKDGFLATHSLVSAVTALLLASDAVANRSSAASMNLVEEFRCASEIALSSTARGVMFEALAHVRRTDTILLLHDPRLLPVALLLETSVWEAAICAIQRTDYRNFAHGRHVWLKHRPDDTLLMSLAAPDSAPVWAALKTAIPESIKKFELEVPNCGRLETAASILRGLTIVEALGAATSIDPAKPGAGEFAEAVYDSTSLRDVANLLPQAVRHKRAAMAKADLPEACSLTLVKSFDALKAKLRNAVFRGMVLDYDGTLVTNEGRFKPPEEPILTELQRLLNDGMRVAIATGRGGSAGESLREVIPDQFHANMLIGYYNGGDIRTLDIDLHGSPLPKAREIEAVERWFDSRPELFEPSPNIRRSSVQIAIDLSSIRDVDRFQTELSTLFASSNSIRIAHSAHTMDVYLASSCKTNVFKKLMEQSGAAEDEILCIGDSGDATGNDYALLGMPYGLSVDQVCCRTDAGWALLGGTVKGPAAVVRILRALRGDAVNGFKMDVDAL